MKDDFKLTDVSFTTTVGATYDGKEIAFYQDYQKGRVTLCVGWLDKDGVFYQLGGVIEPIRSRKDATFKFDTVRADAVKEATGESWEILKGRGEEVTEFLTFVDTKLFTPYKPSSQALYALALNEACERFLKLVSSDRERKKRADIWRT